MTVFTGKLNTNTRIDVRTGSEGPHHDPYGYTKISVFQDANGEQFEVELHCGLQEKLTIKNGNQVDIFRSEGMDDFKNLEDLFETLTGHHPNDIYKIWHKIQNPNRCRQCGSKKLQGMEGFPGETLIMCHNGHMVGYDFDQSAII